MRQNCDLAIAGAIPTTAHVVISLGKYFPQSTSLQNGYPEIVSSSLFIICNLHLTGYDIVMLWNMS